MNLFSISAISDVYVDSFLTDDSGYLIFISVWGRDTAIQEFLARLQLPKSENGIHDFYIMEDGNRRYVNMPNVDSLDKCFAKTKKETVFGVMNHLWIYDKLAVRPDFSNRRALVLFKSSDTAPRLWPIIKSICHLPLLDEWEEIFTKKCFDEEWITEISNGHGMKAYQISLDDNVENVVESMIREGDLRLPDKSLTVYL